MTKGWETPSEGFLIFLTKNLISSGYESSSVTTTKVLPTKVHDLKLDKPPSNLHSGGDGIYEYWELGKMK